MAQWLLRLNYHFDISALCSGKQKLEDTTPLTLGHVIWFLGSTTPATDLFKLLYWKYILSNSGQFPVGSIPACLILLFRTL